MILPNGEVNPENPNEEPQTPTSRDVNFIINDGENPIQGAVVSIGEITGTTGSAGGCTLRNVIDGEHTVSVTAEGYTTKTETITVDETHTSFTISLEADIPTKTVTIQVQDDDTGNGVNGASITIDGEFKGISSNIDGTDGLINVNLPIKDEYTIIVTATGYREYNITREIDTDLIYAYMVGE